MDIDKMAIEVRNLQAFRAKYESLLEWMAEQKTRLTEYESSAGYPKETEESKQSFPPEKPVDDA